MNDNLLYHPSFLLFLWVTLIHLWPSDLLIHIVERDHLLPEPHLECTPFHHDLPQPSLPIYTTTSRVSKYLANGLIHQHKYFFPCFSGFHASLWLLFVKAFSWPGTDPLPSWYQGHCVVLQLSCHPELHNQSNNSLAHTIAHSRNWTSKTTLKTIVDRWLPLAHLGFGIKGEAVGQLWTGIWHLLLVGG